MAGRRLASHEQYLGDGTDRLYVRDIGEGPPVIVLHGGPDFDHEYLVPEMDELAESFRLVYYDQRGRGRSFGGQQADDVSIASETEDLDRVRDHFGFERVAVLGHSWGGLLATEYALSHPEHVSHLILVNTAPVSRSGLVSMTEEMKRLRSPQMVERMAALRSSPAYEAGDIDTDLAYYRLHFASAVRQAELLERVLPRLRSAFTRESVLVARAIENRLYEETWDVEGYDLIPRMRGLDVPVAVIHGDNDLIPMAIARDIADAIPGSRLVVLADCGHFAYLERPAPFRATVAALLERG